MSEINCELCNKHFSQISSRNRHVREQHLQPGLYHCKQCGIRFSKKYNLQVHKEHVHSKNLKTLKCSDCTSNFTKLAALNRHVKKLHNKVLEAKPSPNPVLDVANETDVKTLAESVLKELKLLQREIEPLEDVGPKSSDKEITAIKKGLVDFITVKDNLYPSGHFTLLKVQTLTCMNKVKYLICEFCNKKFRKKYNYLRHRRVHTNVRPFVCILCKKPFPTTAQLKRHCSTHTLNEKFGLFHRLFTCPKCNEGFSSMRQFDKHLCSTSCCDINFKCPHCLKPFKTLKTLLRHKHSEEDKELKMIKKLLPPPLAIDGDIKFTKCKQSYVECNLCGIQVNEKIVLKQHKKRHENLFKNQCVKCQCSFVTQTALKIHTKVHLKSTSFKCHYCSKYFQTEQSCRRHMLNHLKLLLRTHEAFEEKNDSLVLYPTFIKDEEVNQKESNVFPIIKTNREKTSSTSKELKYRCSKCEKSFRYKAWLRKHFNYKHTTDMPHECSNCMKKFRSKQSLKNHLLVHATDRVKITCQVCGRQYASRKSLKLHLRIHTQEKPFVCDKCPKQFRTSGHLIQHRKSNHKGIF